MPTLSQQPRLANTADLNTYIVGLWEQAADDIPAWGKAGRTQKLREFARTEPILSGALASMVAKLRALDWQVIGGRNRARQFQELLVQAEDGGGWQKLIGKWAQDYFGTDLGGFLELARAGSYGPVAGLYHLDASTVTLTGNVAYPVTYTPKLVSKRASNEAAIRFAPEDFARIVEMPSPDEAMFELGFCAVSRALKAARVLLALYKYDEEKLADMPMPGLIAITGMTMHEVKAAFELYQAHRESRGQAVFKGLLWLASQVSALQQIKAELTSFANLPENFDREQTISLYIYTLALDFGVDAREFWPATQSGATKGEAEVQAQKAKGKGIGQALAEIEHALNWKVLPPSIEFAFDRRNDEDDLARAALQGAHFKNARVLFDPPPGQTAGIITAEEARRLLVEWQALPAWIAPTEDVTLHSLDKALDAQLEAKAARLGLGPGEDLVAVKSDGSEHTVWSTRTVHAMPRGLLPDLAATRQAALAHLQAAGLLINGGQDV